MFTYTPLVIPNYTIFYSSVDLCTPLLASVELYSVFQCDLSIRPLLTSALYCLALLFTVNLCVCSNVDLNAPLLTSVLHY